MTLLGNILPNIISSYSENKNIEKQLKIEERRFIRDNKLKAYAEGLEILLSLRKYFDVSKDDFLLAQNQYKKEVEEINNKSLHASVNIRLYGNDKVANLYYELAKYNRFAISNERLFEESKKNFVMYCNVLAKEMRKDIASL